MKRFEYNPAGLTVGALVATLVDQSGNGLDLTQTNTAKQPVVADVDGKTCVKFSGTQFLSRTAVDLTGVTELAVTVACRYFGTAVSCIFEHGTSPLSSGGWGVYANNSRTTLGGGLGNGSTSYRFFNAEPTDLVGAPTVLTLVYRPGTTPAVDVRINGEDVADVSAASAGSPTAALFKSLALYMGARAGTSIFANVEVFGIVGHDSTADIAAAEEWAFSLLPPIPAPVGFERTRPAFTESFAHAEYQTEATVIEFDTNCTIATTFPTFAQIGIEVDGVLHSSVAVPNGASTRQVTLPAGLKTVALVNGPQSRPSGTVLGSWVTAVRANAPLQTPPAGPRVLIYGDSIAAGYDATPVQDASWAMQVRHGLSVPVDVMAYGYRALHDDCSTDAALEAFVIKLADAAPTEIWLAIGTNDCALNKWSATVFGETYAELLDAIHAQMPWAAVYAQSPIVRTNYVSAVADFRAAIATACMDRPWAQYVDGLAILDAADLADNAHPSTAGHAKYADAVLATLGGLP